MSRKKLIAVGLVVVGALTYLLASGFANHSLHDAEVSEIVNNPAKFQEIQKKINYTISTTFHCIIMKIYILPTQSVTQEPQKQ